MAGDGAVDDPYKQSKKRQASTVRLTGDMNGRAVERWIKELLHTPHCMVDIANRVPTHVTFG
jgi:hypothetical protein